MHFHMHTYVCTMVSSYMDIELHKVIVCSGDREEQWHTLLYHVLKPSKSLQQCS